MRELRFELEGPPVPKERARTVTTNHGRRRTYTPKATEDAQEEIILLCRSKRVEFGKSAVEVEMTFQTRSTKVDGDNLEKLVLDAMTKARVYDDDAQVVGVHWLLRRVGKEDPEFTQVVVREA